MKGLPETQGQSPEIISTLTASLQSYLSVQGIIPALSDTALAPDNAKPAEKILLLYSGGLDSSVLLDLLLHIFSDKPNIIHLLHINYHLRGSESDEEAVFIKALATTKGLALHQFDEYLASANTGNIQGLARCSRYRKALEICEQENILHIFTAHHQDDQIETFLLNLLKGKAPKTLAGDGAAPKPYDYLHPRIFLHRPFLGMSACLSKTTLLQYATLSGLGYRTDSSNNTNDYERNYLRNTVIPRLERFKGWEQNLLRVMDYLQGEEQLVHSLAGEYLVALPKWFGVWKIPGFGLTGNFFTKLAGDQKVQLILLHFALTTHYPDYRFAHAEIEEILAKLLGAKTARKEEVLHQNQSPAWSVASDKKLFRHPVWGEIVYSRGWVAPIISYQDFGYGLPSSTIPEEEDKEEETIFLSLTFNQNQINAINSPTYQVQVCQLKISRDKQVIITQCEKDSPLNHNGKSMGAKINLTINDRSSETDPKPNPNAEVVITPFGLFVEQIKKTNEEFRVGGKTLAKKLEGKKYPVHVRKALLAVLLERDFLGVLDPYNYKHKSNSDFWDSWGW